VRLLCDDPGLEKYIEQRGEPLLGIRKGSPLMRNRSGPIRAKPQDAKRKPDRAKPQETPGSSVRRCRLVERAEICARDRIAGRHGVGSEREQA
jgi:hypothetical protein